MGIAGAIEGDAAEKHAPYGPGALRAEDNKI